MRTMDFHRDVISSSAASQVIGANFPSPFAPTRRSGVARRSGEWTSSASRFTLAQAKPAVNGWSGSPSTRIIEDDDFLLEREPFVTHYEVVLDSR